MKSEDKIKLDLNKFIEPIEKLHQKDCRVNRYNLFYDETNNFRKLWIKNGHINETKYNTFVLGGIGFEGDDDNKNMFYEIDLKPEEIKFKTLAKGTFADILKSGRLRKFVESLAHSNYFTHFLAVDIMYYSLVDIIDGLIFRNAITRRFEPYIFELKSFFCQCLMEDRDRLHEVLVKFGYPDIDLKKSKPYLAEIKTLIKSDGSQLSDMIHELIDKAIKDDTFILLEHEDENVLLRDFHQFYLSIIYNNIESAHHLDEETSIQSIIDEYELIYNGSEVKTFHFLDSSKDRRIQYSDIWVGIISRYFDFAKSYTITQLEAILNRFNKYQREAFNNINDIINRSYTKDKFLLHQVMPIFVIERRDWLLDIKL